MTNSKNNKNGFFFEVFEGLSLLGPGHAPSTSRALSHIDLSSCADILDIGCGAGQQTLQLLQETNATLTAIDLHRPFVDNLLEQARNLGLAERLRGEQGDMTALSYPPERFDVLWSEGAIYNIGFDVGLKAWKPLVRPGGHLCVTEAVYLVDDPPAECREFWQTAYPAISRPAELERIAKKQGYEIVDSFALPKRAWRDYYEPMERRLDELEAKYREHEQAQIAKTVFDTFRHEIDIFRRHGDSFSYWFLVLRKPDVSQKDVSSSLVRERFPRSAGYDDAWVMAHNMGPNALWLVEWLSEKLALEPGMRVLDLGCGKALTSIFLAKEFGVDVMAADLWIDPDENWQRVKDAGVADRVCPLKLEAHALPFAPGYFDAIVSIDAYQYFGTDVLYLGYLSRYLRKNGRVGVVVPGLTSELDNGVPEHLLLPQANGKIFWEDDCACFKTADWWSALWRQGGAVDEIETDTLVDGWRYWAEFEHALEQAGKNLFPSDAEALEKDAGRFIGFVRAVAHVPAPDRPNLYDPALAARMGASTTT
jgi:cyclopropane fatty-acyl-phospholipid synthase-like methyltransferase